MPKQFSDGSWGVRVREGKSLKKYPTETDVVVGDGRFGYRSRPQREGVVLVDGVDGQPLLRSARSTAARKRKKPCRLVSRVNSIGINPLEMGEKRLAEFECQRKRKPWTYRFRARKGQKPANQQS